MFQSFDGGTCELNSDAMFKISLKSKVWGYSQAYRPEKRDKAKCKNQK